MIQQIDGKAMTQADEVQSLVESSAVKRRLSLQIKRNGQSETLAVQPGALPQNSGQ